MVRGKVSGTVMDRAELKRALASLQADDVLLVTRLDRFTRSTHDLNVPDDLARQGGGFHSLRDTWADTKTPYGRSVLTIPGSMAEPERNSFWCEPGKVD